MKKLFLDNIEFLPYKPTSEDELVNFVSLNIKDIFGMESIYFEKQKIKAISGIGSIPDGYLIALRDNRWFIVEVELSSHPLHEHIVPQISKFISGIRNPNMRQKLLDYFYKTIKNDIMLENLVKQVIGSGEIYRFISNIISQKPELIIIIDEYTQELKEVCNTLPINSTIIEFKIFQRVGAETIFAFLFDLLIEDIPYKKEEKKPLTASQEKYRKLWTGLIEKFKKRNPGITKRETGKQTYLTISCFGIGGIHLEWSLSGGYEKESSYFGTEIHFEKNDRKFNHKITEYFENKKDELEEKIGERLFFQREWLKNGTWSRIYAKKNAEVITDEVKEWAIDRMGKFYDVFKPMLEEYLKS